MVDNCLYLHMDKVHVYLKKEEFVSKNMLGHRFCKEEFVIAMPSQIYDDKFPYEIETFRRINDVADKLVKLDNKGIIDIGSVVLEAHPFFLRIEDEYPGYEVKGIDSVSGNPIYFDLIIGRHDLEKNQVSELKRFIGYHMDKKIKN